MGLKGSDPGLGFGRSSQLKTQRPLSARSRYLMAPWRNNFLKSFLSPLLGLYFHSVDLALPQETTERKEIGSIIHNLPAPLKPVTSCPTCNMPSLTPSGIIPVKSLLKYDLRGSPIAQPLPPTPALRCTLWETGLVSTPDTQQELGLSRKSVWG